MTWLFDLELNWFRALRLAPEELHETLRHHSACDRRRVWTNVDSEASAARPMMAHNLPPGRYIGLGHRIISA
jgi:hypothetical protein